MSCALTEATNILMNEEGQTHMYYRSLREVKKDYGLKDARSYADCIKEMKGTLPCYHIVSWVNIISTPDGLANYVIIVCKDNNDYLTYTYKVECGKLELVIN